MTVIQDIATVAIALTDSTLIRFLAAIAILWAAMSLVRAPIVGRHLRECAHDRCTCGVYRSAHLQGRGCGNYRKASSLRLWFMDHNPALHIIGRLWLATPEKWRWRIVGFYYDHRPHLCWCDLVDAAYLDVKADDYRAPHGCGCYVPLPTDAGRPRPGCYCNPAEIGGAS